VPEQVLKLDLDKNQQAKLVKIGAGKKGGTWVEVNRYGGKSAGGQNLIGTKLGPGIGDK